MAPTAPPRSIVGALGLTFPDAVPPPINRKLRELQVTTPEEYAANLLRVATEVANNIACAIEVAVQERLAPALCRGEFSDDQIALANACYRFQIRTVSTGGCQVDSVAETLAVGFDANAYQEQLGGPTATTFIIKEDQTLPPTPAPTTAPPTSLPSLPALLIELGLTTLVEAIVAAGILDVPDREGPFTVFGPDNAAFEALPPDIIACLFTTDAGKNSLESILEYHLVQNIYLSSDLSDGQTLETLLVGGGSLTVDFESVPGNVTMVANIVGALNEGTVVSADNLASNGVVHVIDAVLFPPNIEELLQVCNPPSPSPTPAPTPATDEPTISGSPSGSGSGEATQASTPDQ